MAELGSVALDEVLSFIGKVSHEYGVDPNHAKGILLAENMGPTGDIPAVLSTGKISPRGASGLMQVMPATRQALIDQGVLAPEYAQGTDWQSNVHTGLAALKEIVQRRKTNDPRVIAADYNAGPKGGQAVIEGNLDALPGETLGYLKKFDVGQGWLQSIPALAPGTKISSVKSPKGQNAISVTRVSGMEAIEQLMRDNAIWTEQAINAVTRSTETEIAANQQAAASVEQAGQQVGFAEQLKATVEAAGVQARERILEILNLDTRSIDNAVAQKTAEFAAIDPARKAAAAEIDEKNAVGFFDNPLQYLINQTQLPGMIEGHNAMARRQNESLATIQTMQNIASSQMAIDMAASADQIAELGVHVGNAKIAEANAKAETLRAQASSANARLVTTVAGMKERKLDNEIKVLQLSKIVETYRDGDVRKGKEADDEAQLDRDLRRIGALVGAPNMSLSVLKRMSQKDKQEWLDRVAANNIGNNLYEAMTFLKPGMLSNMKNTGSASLAEAVSNFQKITFQNAALEGAKLQAQGGKIPPRDELLRQASSNLETELFITRNNMLLARPYSPYLLNHSAMATEWKGDPNNVVAKMVRDGTTAKIKYNDQQLFTAVRNLVAAGKLSPQQAAQQVSDYYTAGILRNNKNFSFPLLGMSLQDDYKILPKESKKTLNLIAPGELENIFTLAAVRKGHEGFIVPEGMALVPYPGGEGTGFLMPVTEAEKYLAGQKAGTAAGGK